MFRRLNTDLNKHTHLIRFFIYVSLFFVIFFLIKYLTVDLVINPDDAFNIPSRNKFEPRYGNCIWLYINYFFVFYLPKQLGIHYNSWIGEYNVLRSILFFLICLFIAKFSNLNKKSYNIQIAAFITVLLFLSKEIMQFFQYVEVSFITARYVIPLLLTVCAFYYLVKNVIEYNGENKKYTVLSSVLFLLLQINTEIFIVDSLLFLLFTAVFSIFKYKKIIPSVGFPLIAVIIDIIIYLLSGVNVIKEKQGFVNDSINISAFLKSYWEYCIWDIIQILVPIAILFCFYLFVIIKNKTTKNNQYYIFALMILITDLISMFSLIKFNVEFYFTNNLKLVYDILFFIPMFLLINIDCNFIKLQKAGLIKSISILLVLFFVMYHIYTKIDFIKSIWENNKILFKDRKIANYKYEKIFILSAIKNLQPQIDISQYELMNIGFDTNEGENIVKCYNTVFFFHFLFMSQTYDNIENLGKNGFCIVSKKEAEKFYKKINLHFEKDELENADFQKLKNIACP